MMYMMLHLSRLDKKDRVATKDEMYAKYLSINNGSISTNQNCVEFAAVLTNVHSRIRIKGGT